MNVLSRSAVCLVILTLLSAPIVVLSQDDPQPKSETPKAGEATHEGKPVSYWMKKKLDHSKNLLQGIASADYDMIAQDARTMRNLNRIEWFVRSRTPGYRSQLNHFEESLDEMIRQANKKNLEGVTLSFNQMTVSCVKCHAQIRETK